MALFLFVGKGSDITSVLADPKVVESKSMLVSVLVISIGGSVTTENVESGIAVEPAENAVDGALIMKRMMDESKIEDAKCILPHHNLEVFKKVKCLVFPEVCKISVASYLDETSIQHWTLLENVTFEEMLKLKLTKLDSKERVQALQSKIIPSDVFIHGYSKRYGGVSRYPGMKSLNLVYSLRKPDPVLVIKENTRRLCQFLGVEHEKYYLAKANHGNKVWVFEETPPGSYDGIVTNTPGVTVASPAADCNMLLLADPVTKSCGAIHAGWKGILVGIVESAVESMVSSYGCNPKNIKAALGPSLSVCCCEFGVADSQKFLHIGNDVVVWLEGKEKPHINLRVAMTILLKKCGLQSDNIDDGLHGSNPTREIATCTKCDSNKDFFSYRRDGAKFGNQVAFISLRP